MIEHYRRPKKSKKLPISIVLIIIIGIGVWYMATKKEVSTNHIIIKPQVEEVTVKLPNNIELKNQHIPNNNNTQQPQLQEIPLDEVMHLVL